MPLSKRSALIILLFIVLFGSTLSLYHLGESPPGMNVDEGAAIWNAYCLLKTGMDQHGVRWPIFHARVFGDEDERSTLFIYYLIPFLAVRGMEAGTARLAGAVTGVLVLLLIYYCGSRLFGRGTGLFAAALLVANPWHLFLTRSGHEGLLVPLLLLAPLAAMLWAGFPFDDSQAHPPRPYRAVIAGSLAGICCYGYPSNRIFLPMFLATAVVLNWRVWRERLHDRRWAINTGLMLAAAAVFFLPLVWMHLTDPAMSGRAQATWVWSPQDSLSQKIVKVAGRYPMHFGLSFLFENGDRYPTLSPPRGYGEFLWFALPLMIAGLVWAVKRYGTSISARTLMAMVLLYPVGDVLNSHTLPTSPHAFRAAAGLVALILLAACGAASLWDWLRSRGQWIAVPAAGLFLLLAVSMNIVFLRDFFGSYNRQVEIDHAYKVDLIEAFDWLKPRLNAVDAVFCTTMDIPHPYMYSLLRLGYEPRQWFSDKPEVTQIPTRNAAPYEDVTHFGKMYFFYGGTANPAIDGLYRNGRPDHIVFIVRPGELHVADTIKPSLEIRDSDGKISLLVYELNI